MTFCHCCGEEDAEGSSEVCAFCYRVCSYRTCKRGQVKVFRMEIERPDGTVERDGYDAIASSPERAAEMYEDWPNAEEVRVVEVRLA